MKNRTLTPSEFVTNVVKQFTARKGVFSEHRNVEDYVPENVNKLKQALFLFYVIQLDYAIRGRVLYEGATKLWSDNPEFFRPQHILKMSDADLLEVLTKYMKPRYPNEAVIRFKQNSQKLLDDYTGDPMLIFSEAENGKDATKKVLEFRGFGPKTGHLFFRAMVLFFEIEYKDIEEVLPPVDRHDVRIAFYMGYVDSDDMTDKNINLVKEVWNIACREAKENWLIFDQALWLLGSEGKPKSQQDILDLLK